MYDESGRVELHSNVLQGCYEDASDFRTISTYQDGLSMCR